MASSLIAMTQPNAVILYIGFQRCDTASIEEETSAVGGQLCEGRA